ncbi:uncharacterized protein AKAME5_000374000 [Lates japonicus]|uniref:Uncharacterized protein n=1 Tax=Lates japonicus TaxID=270547 RepID=A0AAD3MB74_LATJO|nr:uncharacterized protein AKAME5_000374000 [Lates japonicus]
MEVTLLTLRISFCNDFCYAEKKNFVTLFVTYENWDPASRCEESTYWRLDPGSRDQDQIYFTLTNDCEKEDILIETHANRAQSGRYTIRYNGFLHVIIKELTKSDTGRYRFGVSNSSSLGSYQDFEVKVRASTLEDHAYDTVNPPSPYETLNVHHTACDQMYTALSQRT